MYVNNVSIPKPPPHLLAKCTSVVLGDPKTPMWQMRRWCRENDLSLVWAELVDVEGFSVKYHTIVAFYFIDGQDATAFTLKFR